MRRQTRASGLSGPYTIAARSARSFADGCAPAGHARTSMAARATVTAPPRRSPLTGPPRPLLVLCCPLRGLCNRNEPLVGLVEREAALPLGIEGDLQRGRQRRMLDDHHREIGTAQHG